MATLTWHGHSAFTLETELNIGGGNQFAFGYARMTPAMHGGKVAGDQSGTYTTAPGGWWLDMTGGKVVIPMHYDTWELIAQDAQAFAAAVGDAAEVVMLQPGGSHEF